MCVKWAGLDKADNKDCLNTQLSDNMHGFLIRLVIIVLMLLDLDNVQLGV